jgi:adenylate cyclase
MTVLFTDIRGFTSISESMAPEDLSELMNSFLTPMTGIVHRHGGAIDKYMGDAMMAFWGAPIEDEQHASHAVHAALEMIESLESVNAEFASRGWPRIRIGIGLNTGTMSVGNMGSAFRMAYTVLGDAVNLGSRLEGLTSQYRVPILMNETTARLCDDIELLALDRVRVKGKLEPVRIVTPLGHRGAVPASRLDRAERFRLALHHYHARRWEDALSALKALESECLAEDPEDAHSDASLFGVYRVRCEQMLADPPGPDWDGVVDFVVK